MKKTVSIKPGVESDPYKTPVLVILVGTIVFSELAGEKRGTHENNNI